MKGTSDELVILGAHEDSINGATGRSPGSDDNASGSSTVIEIAKAIMSSNFVPKKTIEFQHYSAEEVGLRGSADICADYKRNNKKVFSMLNMDMTGYNNGQNTVGIATDFTESTSTEFLKKCTTEYSNLKFDTIRCGYACSDHASYQRAGYRSSHIFEAAPTSNMNRAIHTANDVISRLQLPRALELVKVALGNTIELASV